MDVIGHDDVPCESEAVAGAHVVKNLDKYISGARGGKQWQPPVATASDEVQMAQSVAAVQAFRHGKRIENPRP